MRRVIIAVLLLLPVAGPCSRSLAQLDAVREWISIYDGPAHEVDIPTGMALDAAGRAIITGRSTGSGTGQDYATVVYDRQGSLIHELRYNGGFGGSMWDEAAAVVADDSGNIYVTGTSASEGAVTFKYSAGGEVVWQSRYSPDSLVGVAATDIALGPEGEILVVGSGSSGAYSRLLFLRYTPGGAIAATGLFGDDTSWYNNPRVVVGPSGRVYVTARHTFDVTSDVPGFNALTVCFDTLGAVRWSDNRGDGGGVELAVDGEGNLTVIHAGAPYGIIKYDSLGNVLWENDHAGTPEQLLVMTDICIAPDNCIIVSGYDADASGFDAYAQKYSPEGHVLWRERYNGPGDTKDFGMSVVVDSLGNVFLTGSSQIEFSWRGVFILKYDPWGQRIWTGLWDRGELTNSDGQFIALGDSGHIYVGGWTVDTTGLDYLVLRYREESPDGVATEEAPASFALEQNYPNPFNPSTTIRYSFPARSHVTLTVYNMLGQRVATLVEGEAEAGYHEVTFDASHLASGVYLYQLRAGAYAETRILVMLR